MATKTVLRITAKQHGFRRCGVAHPSTPTDYDLRRFSKEQRETLEAESMLVVQEVEFDAGEKKGKQPELRTDAN